MGIGWETRSLKTVAGSERRVWSCVTSLHAAVMCKRCGKERLCLETLVADAPQFYEEVDSMKVTEALDWLIAKAREKGYDNDRGSRSGTPKGFLHKESGFTRKYHEVWHMLGTGKLEG